MLFLKTVRTIVNQQLLKNIHLLAHNLAGSSGTFNHTAIYHKAKAIEMLSNELLTIATIEAIPAHWHKLLLELIVSLRGDAKLSGRPAINITKSHLKLEIDNVDE